MNHPNLAGIWTGDRCGDHGE
ncbi:hypothetical protein MLPM_2091 [Mycobacterium lepromatosis]|uniref:Uncharacterized protein n=1 Tax=Mycobacterium lepromatosis TaxID=480418 RepID=A0A0F4ET16_9MYCO|nr:hypothetical protein MLPM_2091 [Mycobacterium lepromatosis]